jgi:hypothetical protein
MSQNILFQINLIFFSLIHFPSSETYLLTRLLLFRLCYFRHLAGKKHEVSVEKFIKDLPNTFRKRFKKKHFRLTQGAFDKFMSLVEHYQIPESTLDQNPTPVQLEPNESNSQLSFSETNTVKQDSKANTPVLVESYAGVHDNRSADVALQNPGDGK